MRQKLLFFTLSLLALIAPNFSLSGQCAPEILELDSVYCSSAATVDLNAYPPGGIFSGPGVTGDQFDPVTAGVGTHTIKYISDSIMLYEVREGLDFDTVPGFGTSITITDESVSSDLPIGFEFTFFGNEYNTVRIGSNGFLTFTSSSPGGFTGQRLPDPAAPNDLIAFAYEDYTGGIDYRVEYFTLLEAPNRIFVVNFRNVPHYAPTGLTITTQVVLYEGSNKIRVNLSEVTANGNPMTLGIENLDASMAFTADGKNATVWNAHNESYEFVPYYCYDSTEVNVKVADYPETLVLSDTLIEFNDVFVGETVMHSIIFSNPGCSMYSFTSGHIQNTEVFQLIGDSPDVPARGSLRVDLYFSPNAAGSLRDTIKLTSAIGDTIIVVEASAIEPPVMVSYPESISAEIAECGGAVTDTIVVKNTGTNNLNIEVLSLVAVNDDFEDENADGWESDAENLLSVIEEGNNQVLKIEGAMYGDPVVKQFPASMPTEISFKFKPEWVRNRTSHEFIIADESSTQIMFQLFNEWNEPVTFVVNGRRHDVILQEWYQIDLRNIDWDTHEFDLYINDALMISGQDFVNPVNQVDAIHFFNYEDVTAYLDDVVIGTTIDWLTVTPEMATVEPNDSVHVLLTPITNELKAGSYTTPIYIFSNDPENRTDTVHYELDYSGAAELELSKTAVNIEGVFTDVGFVDTIYVENIGCDTLKVDSLRLITGSEFVTQDLDGAILLPGQTAPVLVGVMSASPGNFIDTIRFYTNALTGTIPLSAEVVVPPDMSLSHSSILNIEISECGGSVDSILVIDNTSTTPLEFTVETAVLSKVVHEDGIRSNAIGWSYSFEHLPNSADAVHLNLTLEVVPPGAFRFANINFGSFYSDAILLDRDLINLSIDAPASQIASELADGEINIGITPYSWAGSEFVVNVTAEIAIEATNWLSAEPMTGTVEGLGSQNITLSANSLDYPNGSYTQSVIIRSNDPDYSEETIDVSMIVDGSPDMQITDAIDFGSALINDSVYREVVVYNNGCGPLTVTDIYAPTEIRFSETAFTVPPQSRVELRAWYRPTGTTAIDGSDATVVTPDGNTTIALTGVGVNTPPIFHIDSTSLTALSQCEYEHVIPVTIWNTGEADLQFDIESSNPAFVYLSEDMGVVSMNDSTVIEITFDGKVLAKGEYTGNVTVNTNDPDLPQQIMPFTFADSNGVLVHASILNESADACEGSPVDVIANNGAASYYWSTAEESKAIQVAESGTYSVTVVDYNGCESTADMSLTFHEPMPALGNDTTICTGDDLTIQATEGMVSYLWSTDETSSAITVSAAGTYSVAVADIYGCENTDNIIVAISELPTVNLGANQSITNGESATLNAGTQTSYLWSTGATTQTIDVVGSTVGVGTHTYSVTVANEFTCEATDEVVVTVSEGVGINEYKLGDETFSLYPNPTEGLFYLSSEDALNSKVSVTLSDLTGRVILIKQYNSFAGNEAIDISNLAAGMYSITIQAGDAEFKTNIILE